MTDNWIAQQPADMVGIIETKMAAQSMPVIHMNPDEFIIGYVEAIEEPKIITIPIRGD